MLIVIGDLLDEKFMADRTYLYRKIEKKIHLAREDDNFRKLYSVNIIL